MVSSLPTQSEQPKRRSNDPISWYLQNIGRVPLLTPAEEIELGNQVQKMMILTEDGQLNEKINDFTTQQKRTIKIGRRAKERMMKANLRLVVSVAKKYQGKGLELLDLVQEGSLGLERAVEKFDPTRGYKFSTYAFWWIRQSMTRAIACQSRTIRLPVHLSERLASIRKISGKPIKFIGVGEKIEALQPFHPERMASRILGMGDVLTLVEKAQKEV